MHVHILGIAGTFMGGIAALAKSLGHRVTGCDKAVYPPMSDQLQALGIEFVEGFDEEQLGLNPDVFIVGNAISRGNPLLEAILNQGLRYTSGPAWLAEYVLQDRWVVAVSGTHGKTTTSSMVTHILREAGLQPGYLIGGVAKGFDKTAELGETPFFVIEADEYDTAFFDKRSKFVHYRPRTLIINNLEFDHADIFNDLAAIQTQFHHLVRIIPNNGQVISFEGVETIEEVIEKGCWTPRLKLAEVPEGNNNVGPNSVQYRKVSEDGRVFEVMSAMDVGRVTWSLTGDHNVQNGVAAIAAARHVGVPLADAAQILGQFEGVKRRMELIAEGNGCYVYDDFAHHPTAIKTTLEGLRAHLDQGAEKAFRIWCVIEPCSNTMKSGLHRDALSSAVQAADKVLFFLPRDMGWEPIADPHKQHVFKEAEAICQLIKQEIAVGDHIVLMSNGAFKGVRDTLPGVLGLAS